MDNQSDFLKAPSSFPKLKLNRKISVIILCALISTIFWFLIALSKVYSSKLVFPLKYTNYPEQKVITNDLPAKIEVAVKTTGFKILAYHLQNKHDSVVFDIQSKLDGSKEAGKDIIAIPSKLLTNDFTEQLGTEYSVVGFYPDTIAFNFSNRSQKKVPVVLNASITLEKQYDTTDHPVLVPDSVIVSGPTNLLADIKNVETMPLSFTNLKTTTDLMAGLKSHQLVNYNLDRVKVSIPVEKYTEGSVEVPVHVINVKPGFALKTYPEKISIHYRVSLSNYNRIGPEMFDAVANAESLPDKDVQELKVTLLTVPTKVKMATLDPDKVDYILRKQ